MCALLCLVCAAGAWLAPLVEDADGPFDRQPHGCATLYTGDMLNLSGDVGAGTDVLVLMRSLGSSRVSPGGRDWDCPGDVHALLAGAVRQRLIARDPVAVCWLSLDAKDRDAYWFHSGLGRVRVKQRATLFTSIPPSADAQEPWCALTVSSLSLGSQPVYVTDVYLNLNTTQCTVTFGSEEYQGVLAPPDEPALPWADEYLRKCMRVALSPTPVPDAASWTAPVTVGTLITSIVTLCASIATIGLVWWYNRHADYARFSTAHTGLVA